MVKVSLIVGTLLVIIAQFFWKPDMTWIQFIYQWLAISYIAILIGLIYEFIFKDILNRMRNNS
jgi:hypothetical protein